MIKKLLVFMVFLFSATMSGQQRVEASVDSVRQKIGAQIKLTLRTTVDTNSTVVFPSGKNFGALEVIRSFTTDTIAKGKQIELIKKYGLTQFDSGKYVVPGLRVLINNKPFFTDSIKVEVTNVKVDTTKQKLFDIKDIINTGSSNTGWWKYLLMAVVIAAIGFLLYRFIKKRHQQSIATNAFKTPIEKAAVLLQQLEKKELWQKGEIKNYYSELTDIARNYIEEAINIPAMESTTAELIAALRNAAVKKNMSLSQETVGNLENVLKHADLVKFAKSQPLDYEIADDRTKIEKAIYTLDESIPEQSEDDALFNEMQKQQLLRRQKRNRIVITVGAVLFLMLATSIYFVATKGYDYVKDNIIGHRTKDMLEGEWILSNYGDPAIVIETPKVLKRMASPEKLVPGNPEDFKSRQIFVDGSLLDSFSIILINVVYASQSTINLEVISDMLTENLATQGAKNIILKQEEFQGKDGVTGVKVYGSFKIKDPTGDGNKSVSYQNLVFAEFNGLQQITITHEEGDKYGEQIAARVLNSVELKTTTE